MNKILFFLLWLLPIISFTQVVLYSECNYRGKTTTLGPGNYYSSYSGNNSGSPVQSLKVPYGFRIELFADRAMMSIPYTTTGNKSCITYQVPSLIQAVRVTYSGDNGFGNINPEEGVSIFSACQFSGRNAFLPPGNYSNLRNVFGNNSISSFRVPIGMVLELFEGENFWGASSGKITGSNQCLSGWWNNRASSAKVYYESNGGYLPPEENLPYNPNEANINIYTACSYRGKSFTFGIGNTPYLRYSLNNQIPGSLRIPQGMTVTLYSATNYGGSVLGRYTSNNPCLSYTAQISAQSMRVTGYPTGVYPPPGVGGSNNDITLFTNCNFSGKSIKLGEGRYASIANIGNVYASSLRIPNGYAVTLFLGKNFTGTSSGRITSTIECLGSTFRQRFQSLIVEQWDNVTYPPVNSGNAVVIFSGCNYTGSSVRLGQGNFSSISSLNNISPSSLQIPNGYTVTLFTGRNYTGISSGKLTSNNNCLGSEFRGRVQSLTIERTNAGDAVVVYSGCNYSGSSVKLDQGDFASISSINYVSPSSLQIPAGYIVTLFTGKNFTGASSGKITADINCLGTAFKGKVQSLTVERSNGGGTYPPPPSGNIGSVVFYTSCNFTGSSREVNQGAYANINTIGITPSSLRIPRDWEVILFTGTNFSGSSSGTLTINNACLNSSFRGRVKSAIINYVGNNPHPR